MALISIALPSMQAANLYWDGSSVIGLQAADGNFGTSTFWNGNSTGNGTLTTWGGAANSAYFNGNNTSNVTINSAVSGTSFFIGNSPANGTVTTVNLSGSSSLTLSGSLNVGFTTTGVGGLATANLNQSSGNVTTTTINIGRFGTNGTYNLDGGTVQATGLYIASNTNTATTGIVAPIGVLNINGGSMTINGSILQVGASGRAGYVGVGTLNLNSGNFISTSGSNLTLSAGNYSSGTVNLNGGIMTVRAVTATAGTTGADSTFRFNGGTLKANSSATGAFLSGLTNAFIDSGGAFIDLNAKTISISQALLQGNGTGGLTVLNTGGASGNLTLSAANTFAGATTISSGVLILGNSSALQNSALDTTASVTGNSTAGLRTTVSTLTLGGLSGNKDFSSVFSTTSGNYSTVTALTLNPATGASHSYSGAISNGAAGMTLTKTGNGTQILSGNNSYTGNTTISVGALNIQHANALGGTGNGTVVSSGAALQIQGNVSVGAEALSLSGSGVSSDGVLRNISGSNSYAGAITLGAASRINSDAGSLTLSGGISGTHNLTIGGSGNTTISAAVATGSGTLTKDDSGTLTLSGNNTFTGGTTITAGTIQISSTGLLGGGNYSANIANNGSLIVGSSSNQAFSGVISGNGDLNKTGTGTLTLSNASNTYSGATTINGGTLLGSPGTATAITINSGGTLAGTSTVGDVTVNSGGFISVGNSSGDIGTRNVGALTLNGGGTYTWDFGNISGSAGTNWDLLNVTGALTINSTSGNKFTIAINGTPTGWAPASTQTWAIMNYGSLTNPWDASVFDATGLSGAGTWSFTNDTTNKFIGLTYTVSSVSTWNGGSGNWSTGFSSAPADGAATVFAGAGGVATNNISSASLSSLTTIIFDSTAGSYTLAADSGSAGYNTADPLAVNSVTNDSANASTLNLALNIGSELITNTAAGNLTLGGVVSGTGGLTKTGNATLFLSANNTYSGTTTLSAGTLALHNPAATIGTGALTISGGTLANTSGSAITLVNNNSQNWNSSFTFAGSSDLNLGTGAVSLGTTPTVTIDSAALTVGGAISGAGYGLTKAGAGTLILSGSNAYTGTTTVSAGALNIRDSNALGATGSGTVVSSGAALQIQGNVSVGAEALSLSGSGVSSDGALRNISGTNSYAGAITLGAASRINSDAGSLTLSGGISGTHNLTIGGSGNTTISGVVATGSGTLTKDGSGTLTLSGNNTYTGGTTITAGTLQISSTSLLAGGNYSANIANNGSLIVGSTSNQTLSGVISGNGDLNKTGTGRLALTGASNTFNGTLTASNGTLSFASIGSSSAFVMNGGNLESTAATTIGSLAVLQNANFNIVGSITNNITSLTGSGELTLTRSSGAVTTSKFVLKGSSNTFNGTIIVGANSTLTNPTLTFDNEALLGSNVNALTLNAGRLTLNDSATANNQTLANHTVTLGEGGGAIVIRIGVATITGGITGIGALTIGNHVNTATLELGGSNDYSGNTTILTTGAPGNTVRIIADNVIPYGIGKGDLILSNSGTGANPNRLDLNGFNLNVNGLSSSGSVTSIIDILTAGGSSTLTVGNNDASATFAGSIQNTTGTVSLVKVGNGTQTLAGTNTYAGGTTINSGTLVIGSAAAAGAGIITQSSGSSLLKIDTTGTITNNMSIYNVLASQSATLSGAIEVKNATFEVDPGDTLTISSTINGTGGITKNGDGNLVLSGSNTYSGATTVNAGTLEADHASALGANNTVTVNGGSLLVSYDGVLSGKNITLASNSTTIAALSFNGTTYNGTIGTLTLSANSIIDLGDNSVVAHFAAIAGLNDYILKIYNWTGTTLWNGGDGNNTDQIYFGSGVSGNLNRISFYSDFGSSFLGTGYQIMSGGFANEVIPVPEPETWATAALLLLGGGIFLLRRKKQPAQSES